MLLTRKVITMPHLFLNTDLIEEVRSYKYLGVTVSKDMKWDMHITSICQRSKKLYLGLCIEDFVTVLMQYSLFVTSETNFGICKSCVGSIHPKEYTPT